MLRAAGEGPAWMRNQARLSAHPGRGLGLQVREYPECNGPAASRSKTKARKYPHQARGSVMYYPYQ